MKKIPLIMDVDTGTDDAIAIICALMSVDILDIKAFTTVAGNVGVDLTSRNTLNLVRALGFDIPVAVGARKPLKKALHTAISHGSTGLGDVHLPRSENLFYPKDAVDTIYQYASSLNGELELLAVGPLTNVAEAILRHPDLIKLIKRITIMGGTLRGGNMTQTSEFNCYVDPDASKIVFESGIPLVMIGLDVTLKPQLPLFVYEQVKACENKFARIATQIFDFMLRRNEQYGFDPPNLHDAIALASILLPNLITFKNYHIEIETEGTITRGMTVADFNHVLGEEPNVQAAVDIDCDMFWEWLINKFRDADQSSAR
ncbi:nucleoside hydrolase [Sporolactobacillus laevolacticus]|uniref:nucleoside hydrolase n=1 Tax=Sporolactobacillus laevolacticus TaxID=33018 RepID=UPI0025B340F5|nr:nucleoside hydrolase [Sporolactobacillus laevolacticus]MDN3956459.1 nucleoside hydrolase [Sporolactobacillus laevolacticus]